MRPVPVAGDHALVEVEQQHIFRGFLVGGQHLSQLCKGRVIGGGGLERLHLVIGHLKGCERLAGELRQLVEGHPVAALCRKSGPCGIAQLLKQSRLGQHGIFSMCWQAAQAVDGGGDRGNRTGRRGELRFHESGKRPVIRGRALPQIVRFGGERRGIGAELGGGLVGHGRRRTAEGRTAKKGCPGNGKRGHASDVLGIQISKQYHRPESCQRGLPGGVAVDTAED